MERIREFGAVEILSPDQKVSIEPVGHDRADDEAQGLAADPKSGPAGLRAFFDPQRFRDGEDGHGYALPAAPGPDLQVPGPQRIR